MTISRYESYLFWVVFFLITAMPTWLKENSSIDDANQVTQSGTVQQENDNEFYYTQIPTNQFD